MDELRYGYTMRDLQRIAGHAASTAWTHALTAEDKFEAAWDGVVEELYSPDYGPHCWPTGDMLINAGRRAVLACGQAEQHHHGVRHDRRDTGFGSMPSFQRYWCFASRPYPSPESRTVESVALAQILSRLYPSYRKALAARAVHATHEAAAEALGMKLASYRATLNAARTRFLELWHEGEQPSRIWRIDRLVNAYGELSNRTSAAQLRSNRRVYARTRSAAKAADRRVIPERGAR